MAARRHRMASCERLPQLRLRVLGGLTVEGLVPRRATFA